MAVSAINTLSRLSSMATPGDATVFLRRRWAVRCLRRWFHDTPGGRLHRRPGTALSAGRLRHARAPSSLQPVRAPCESAVEPAHVPPEPSRAALRASLLRGAARTVRLLRL